NARSCGTVRYQPQRAAGRGRRRRGSILPVVLRLHVPCMAVGEPELTEDGAYPAQPDNEYGWEKLYAERVLQAYARNRGLTARIARFQNCYGPEGTWTGGREKGPAAICPKG